MELLGGTSPPLLARLQACLPLPRDFSEDPGISLNPGIIVSKLTVKHDIFSDSKTLLDFGTFSKFLRPAGGGLRKTFQEIVKTLS